MDIRTWQAADRADDARSGDPGPGSGARSAYRARHRSARGPFGPLRPGPIAIGSLSTAAVAAIAILVPHLIEASSAANSTVIDGMPNHLAPITPGPTDGATPDGSATSGATQSAAPGQTTHGKPGAKASPATAGHPGKGVATPSLPGATTSAAVDVGQTGANGGPTGAATPIPGGPGGGTPSATTPAPGGGTPGVPSSSPTTPGSQPSTPAPQPSSTPPSTTPPASFNAAAAQQTALDAIASLRQTNNVSQLSVDPLLSQVAASHTSDMVRHHMFSHTGSDGSTPVDRAYGIGCWSFDKEIIARGSTTTDIVSALMRDPQASAALAWGWHTTIGVSAQLDPTTGQVLWSFELGWG